MLILVHSRCCNSAILSLSLMRGDPRSYVAKTIGKLPALTSSQQIYTHQKLTSASPCLTPAMSIPPRMHVHAKILYFRLRNFWYTPQLPRLHPTSTTTTTTHTSVTHLCPKLTASNVTFAYISSAYVTSLRYTQRAATDTGNDVTGNDILRHFHLHHITTP